jgi:hypothetical protein
MMQAIDRLIEREANTAILSKTDARESVYAKIVAAGVGALTDFKETRTSKK